MANELNINKSNEDLDWKAYREGMKRIEKEHPRIEEDLGELLEEDDEDE